MNIQKFKKFVKNIEPTKASIGSYIGLPYNLKNSYSIINFCSYKHNCLQKTITAWLHPAKDHATRESNYANKLIVPWQRDEDDFDIIRTLKLYKIYIWLHTLWQR